jgi:hypothetical protein
VNVTKKTVKIVPNEFHEDAVEGGDAFLLMKVQGVGCQHLLYGTSQEKVMWYYVRPDGGPVDWLRRWSASPQDFVLYEYNEWGMDYWRAFDQAALEVLRTASDELLEELR